MVRSSSKIVHLNFNFVIQGSGLLTVEISPTYDPHVGEVPAKDGTCPGPSAF